MHVHPLPEEEEYLLAVVRHYFPALNGLTRGDITHRFAGLRVLPAATQAAFDRSRETIFTVDRDVRPRVLGIYGGKLTGWRAAAAHVMERISPSLPTSRKTRRDGSVDFEETDHEQACRDRAAPGAVGERRLTRTTTSVRRRSACAYRWASFTRQIETDMQARQQHRRSGHSHQRGEPIWSGQESDFEAEISGHGARRANGTGCALIISPWIAPATPPLPSPSYFAMWCCCPAIR